MIFMSVTFHLLVPTKLNNKKYHISIKKDLDDGDFMFEIRF